MKKKVMRLALLLVLPVAAAFVFSAYTDGDPDPQCQDYSSLNYLVIFPHPDDARYYYVCNNGVAILMQCPDGLCFNARLLTCDWCYGITGDAVPCTYSSTSGKTYIDPTTGETVTIEVTTSARGTCCVGWEDKPCVPQIPAGY